MTKKENPREGMRKLLAEESQREKEEEGASRKKGEETILEKIT